MFFLDFDVIIIIKMHNAHPANGYLHLACLPTIELQTDHDDEDHFGRSDDNDDDDENDKGHRDRDDLISMIIVSVRKL